MVLHSRLVAYATERCVAESVSARFSKLSEVKICQASSDRIQHSGVMVLSQIKLMSVVDEKLVEKLGEKPKKLEKS